MKKLGRDGQPPGRGSNPVPRPSPPPTPSNKKHVLYHSPAMFSDIDTRWQCFSIMFALLTPLLTENAEGKVAPVQPWDSATIVSVRWILVRQVVRMGVDETGSGSCPMTGFDISGVEPWGSATTVSVIFQVKRHNKHIFCPNFNAWGLSRTVKCPLSLPPPLSLSLSLSLSCFVFARTLARCRLSVRRSGILTEIFRVFSQFL
jgi:hypothetical protein